MTEKITLVSVRWSVIGELKNHAMHRCRRLTGGLAAFFLGAAFLTMAFLTFGAAGFFLAAVFFGGIARVG